jgi:hypothetical protein
MSPKRLALVVAACAIVAHVGVVFNGFALDDIPIITLNPLVRGVDGVWSAFLQPYWPPDLGGKMYRPLPIVSYAADGLIGTPWWFHAVNVLWHAGVAIGLALFARRLAGGRAALAAGLVFAVHPVHVEAIANVVGRAELMATAFAALSVYAAVTRRHPAWSAAAFAAGLLCKENAVVAPALVAWAWIVGIERPPRRAMAGYAVWWLGVAAAYAAVRWQVLHPYARFEAISPAFVNQSPVAIRMTAVAALTDLVRLLVFPARLRVEYSPNERSIVTSPLDSSFLIGCVVLAWWIMLLAVARRRGRTIEAFGLGWIALAYLPVANLLFPTGVVMAERTLYLPSAGFALALGALLAPLDRRRYAAILAVLVVVGGIRSALRVPVWRDDATVTLSILRDSPQSYRGPTRAGAMFQTARDPGRAFMAYRSALKAFDQDAAVYVAAADAAFTLHDPRGADSLLERANRICFRCSGLLRHQAASARARGDSATADSLFARARMLDQP